MILKCKDNRQAKIYYKITVCCFGFAILFLILSAKTDDPKTEEFFWGIMSSVFFIFSTLACCKACCRNLNRSTVYTLGSITVGIAGLLFLLLGRFVLPAFAYGNLLFYYGAGILGLLSLAVIIANGEIFRPSGVIKIVSLFVTACIIGRCVVLTASSYRGESLEDTKQVKQTTSDEAVSEVNSTN